MGWVGLGKFVGNPTQCQSLEQTPTTVPQTTGGTPSSASPMDYLPNLPDITVSISNAAQSTPIPKVSNSAEQKRVNSGVKSNKEQTPTTVPQTTGSGRLATPSTSAMNYLPEITVRIYVIDE